MWFFTVKRVGETRPALTPCPTEDLALALKARMESEEPDTEFGAVFEEEDNYPCTYPHVIGECTNLDGSLDLLWSDSVRTPKPV